MPMTLGHVSFQAYHELIRHLRRLRPAVSLICPEPQIRKVGFVEIRSRPMQRLMSIRDSRKGSLHLHWACLWKEGSTTPPCTYSDPLLVQQDAYKGASTKEWKRRGCGGWDVCPETDLEVQRTSPRSRAASLSPKGQTLNCAQCSQCLQAL
jgi:hypothetical protein